MLRYRLRTFPNLPYNPLLTVPDITRVRGPNRNDTVGSEVQNTFTNPVVLSRFIFIFGLRTVTGPFHATFLQLRGYNLQSPHRK
jgi:hypothetical protein